VSQMLNNLVVLSLQTGQLVIQSVYLFQ